MKKMLVLILSVAASVVGCDAAGGEDACYYCAPREKTQCWSCNGFQTCVISKYESPVECRSSIDGICFDSSGASRGLCRDSSECRPSQAPYNESCE